MELVTALGGVAKVVEQGGVIALLVLIAGVLGWELVRIRKELKATYQKMEKWKIGFALCKQACDSNDIKVDLSVMQDLLEQPGPGGA